MNDGDTTSALTSTMYDLLAEDREIPDLLDDLTRLAAEHFREDQDIHCGIILRRDKTRTVVATSSDLAGRTDEIQAGFGDGPCLESLATKTVVTVTDIRTEERWPGYMRAIREFGLGSVLAVPLDLGDSGDAAMNFYAMHPGAFGDDEVAYARRHTDLIAKALRIALRTAEHADTAQNRRAAMENRTPIDMAIGIVMAQNSCSPDEAFSILQRASSHRNVKLRDLARDVVASLGHGAPDTRFEP